LDCKRTKHYQCKFSGWHPTKRGVHQTRLRICDALITITNANLFTRQKRITELAIKHKLPSMFQGSAWVDSGGLMSYSTDEFGAFRRAAYYVDRILKGAKPADLPVEQAVSFELAINLRTAKALGLTVPPLVLTRATKVIK
jgi:putative ABC transport system substrate-binding protein